MKKRQKIWLYVTKLMVNRLQGNISNIWTKTDFFLLCTFFKKGKKDTPDLRGPNKISSTDEPEKKIFLFYTFFKKGKRDTQDLEGSNKISSADCNLDFHISRKRLMYITYRRWRWSSLVFLFGRYLFGQSDYSRGLCQDFLGLSQLFYSLIYGGIYHCESIGYLRYCCGYVGVWCRQMQRVALPLDTKEKKEASKATDICGLHPLSLRRRFPLSLLMMTSQPLWWVNLGVDQHIGYLGDVLLRC